MKTHLNVSSKNGSPRSGYKSGDSLEWQTLSRRKMADCKVFSVNEVRSSVLSQDGLEANFYTLECGAWVNVIALTDEMELVMVQQYRHGVEELTLEIPGGSVDIDDLDPLSAAQRELREETGFVSDRWSLLGTNHPNPALQNNFCYTYLAEGARLIESPKFDDSGTERIVTRYVDPSDLNSLVTDGTISHALVIVAFHFLTLKRPELLARVQ